MSWHGVGGTTAGTLPLAQTSALRRCYFAIVQLCAKAFLGSVPLITSERAVPPLLSSGFPLFFTSWSCQHKWPWGREQQATGTEQHGLRGRPPTSEGTPPPPPTSEGDPGRADVPPKGSWFLPHKLQQLIDVTVFCCKLNNCTHYAALRIWNNCVRFCFLSGTAMIMQPWQDL